MTDRPILFSAPMVRALLDGRKTMTRRVQTTDVAAAHRVENTAAGPIACEYDRRWPVRTKFSAGDRLWVRETCATWGRGPERAPVEYPVAYAADDPEWEDIKHDARVSAGDEWKVRPSIHMPRWASRLTLVVTGVRVERLQDISEADAIAEGVERLHRGFYPYGISTFVTAYVDGREVPAQCCRNARDSFHLLWDHINGPGAWEANPWVTVTSFDVRRQNIDQMEAA